MKIIIRAFFKTLRVIIGPFMLLGEFIGRPKGVVRPPAVQSAVDQQCREMVLYQYKTCPFCIKKAKTAANWCAVAAKPKCLA